MILIQDILTEAGVYRSKTGEMDSTEKEKLRKLLDTKCRVAVESKMIFRGVRRKEEWFYYNQAHTERVAAGGIENYYNMMLSNSKYWKSYPRRDRSTIGTFDEVLAKGYRETGAVYQCFPVGDPDIGICPASDLWGSFSNLSSIGVTSLEHINGLLLDCYARFIGGKSEIDSFNYNIFVKSFEVDSNTCNLISNSLYKHDSKLAHAYEKYVETNKSGNLVLFFESYIKPEDNDFELVKLSQTNNFKHEYREVWWTGPTLFIRDDIAKGVLQ